MGNAPQQIKADDWNGTWITKDGCVVVKVTNPEKGQLIAALIESEKDGLKLKKYDIELRGTNNFIFLNIKADKENDKQLYIWGKIRKEGKEAVVWGTDTGKFRDLVNAGKLPGKIKDKDVYLEALNEEQRKFIESEENALLFNLNHPSVFYRLGN